MINAIESHLLRNWNTLFSDFKKPGHLSFLQVTPSQRRKPWRSKINLLFFKDNDALPFVVAKFYAHPEGNELLEQEYHHLRLLHTSLIGNITPRPFGKAMICGRLVTFEQHFTGRSIHTELKNFIHSPVFALPTLLTLIAQHFDLASSIITALNGMSQPENQNALDHELEQTIQGNIRLLKCEDRQKTLVENTLKRVRAVVQSQPTRRRIVAFDFVPQNVIVGEQRTVAHLIDWEFASNSTLLFLEPIKFLFHYLSVLWSLKIFRGTFPEFLDATFQSDNWLFPPIMEFLNRAIPKTHRMQPATYQELFLPHLLYELSLHRAAANQPKIFIEIYKPLILHFSGRPQAAEDNLGTSCETHYRLTPHEIKETNRRHDEEIADLQADLQTVKRQSEKILQSRSYKLANRIYQIKRMLTPKL